jgi:hypothetical protein
MLVSPNIAQKLIAYFIYARFYSENRGSKFLRNVDAHQ